MINLIKKLTEAYGPSGREEEVRSIIKEEIEGKVDETIIDSLGNLIAIKKGEGKKIMVAAHMDEIGVIVTYIDEKGFLRFSPVGGISAYTLIGKRFVFPNGILATVGIEKSKDIRSLSFNKLFLDIGAKDKKEANTKINIGDIAVYEGSLVQCGERLSGKAFDDRIGCTILIKVLERIKTNNEVYFVFTVQEELGLRGAKTAAYKLNPDYGLAVDVTRIGDTPESEIMDVALGKGPTIKIKDSSVICHPYVKEKMISIAERNKIPYQFEILEQGGTDAGAIHLSREGIPAGVMSVPCRYIHTAAEMIDMQDVENSVNFLKLILEEKWD